MNNPVDALNAVTGDLSERVAIGDLRTLDDDALLGAVQAIEALGRRVDALRVASAAEVAERSRKELGTGGLAARKGCRNTNELLQRITLVSGASAEKRIRLGGRTRFRPTLVGFDTPPLFPRVSNALSAGELGMDAAEAIVAGLLPVFNRATIAGREAAERELVAAATGTGAEAPVAFSADQMRIQAQVWQLALDPDGADMSEDRAMTKRELRLGRVSDGLIPVYGRLMPEIAAKLTTLLDACLSPRTAPSFMAKAEAATAAGAGHDAVDTADADAADAKAADKRSIGQRRHDVFAALIDGIARSGGVPTVGGAAPTVLVTVRSEDVADGHGAGYIDGLDVPISMRAVTQFLCTGGSQPVLMRDGGVLHLFSPQRCFNRKQRRAIGARDGGCIIPGCDIPANWCEFHHVIPDRDGGPTQVDNGVCLCWFHHRTIDTAGWQIRMIRGAPQIKAPPWINPNAQWRPATKARTTLAAHVRTQEDEAIARQYDR
ncbi:MAG: DUF222 domain-containing protein [Microbacteriaceae bacterium]